MIVNNNKREIAFYDFKQKLNVRYGSKADTRENL